MEFSGRVDNLNERNAGMRSRLKSALDRETLFASHMSELEREKFDYEKLCSVYQENLKECDGAIERHQHDMEVLSSEVREARTKVESYRNNEVTLLRAVQDLQRQLEYYKEESSQKTNLQEKSMVDALHFIFLSPYCTALSQPPHSIS